jgi:hypothetical protein
MSPPFVIKAFRCASYPLIPMEDTPEGLTGGRRKRIRHPDYDN